MMQASPDLIAHANRLQTTTWHAFYRGLTTDTPQADLAPVFLAGLYYGTGSMEPVCQELGAAVSESDSLLAEFYHLLHESAEIVQPFTDTHGFLPFIGGDDIERFFGWRRTRQIQQHDQYSIDGLDALESVYLLTLDMKNATWEYDSREDPHAQLDAYPFAVLAEKLGFFLRTHVLEARS